LISLTLTGFARTLRGGGLTGRSIVLKARVFDTTAQAERFSVRIAVSGINQLINLLINQLFCAENSHFSGLK